jgi:hypothetical protein
MLRDLRPLLILAVLWPTLAALRLTLAATAAAAAATGRACAWGLARQAAAARAYQDRLAAHLGLADLADPGPRSPAPGGPPTPHLPPLHFPSPTRGGERC